MSISHNFVANVRTPLLSRRSHPAQHGETFDWSANLIAKRFRASEGGYILSFLRKERLGEKGGAFLKGKEGRVGFRKKSFLAGETER